MTEIIVENSLYKTPQEKEEFISDKQKVATAFWINLLGMFGLFSFSSKKGLMKTYFQEDGQLRLSNITDENKDLSLLVKLYQEAGGLPMDTANKLTRLLVKMKQKAITSKNFDHALFREIASEIRWNSVRPHPLLVPIVKGFVDGVYPLESIGKELYYVVKTRKKDFLPLANEFYSVAKQYIPAMTTVPRLDQLATQQIAAPIQTPQQVVAAPISAPSPTPQVAPATATVAATPQAQPAAATPQYSLVLQTSTAPSAPATTTVIPTPVVAPPAQTAQTIVKQTNAGKRSSVVPVDFETLYSKIYLLPQVEISKAVKEAKVDSDDFKKFVSDILAGNSGNLSQNFYDDFPNNYEKFMNGIVPWANRGGLKPLEYMAKMFNDWRFVARFSFSESINIAKKFPTKLITEKVVVAMTLAHASKSVFTIGQYRELRYVFPARMLKSAGNTFFQSALKKAWEESEYKIVESMLSTIQEVYSIRSLVKTNVFGFYQSKGYNIRFDGKFSDEFNEKTRSWVWEGLMVSRPLVDFGIASVDNGLFVPFYDSDNTYESYKKINEESFTRIISLINTRMSMSAYADFGVDKENQYQPLWFEAQADVFLDDRNSGAILANQRATLRTVMIALAHTNDQGKIEKYKNYLRNNFDSIKKYTASIDGSITMNDKVVETFKDDESLLLSYIELFPMVKLKKHLKSSDPVVNRALLQRGIFTKETLENADFDLFKKISWHNFSLGLLTNKTPIELFNDEQRSYIAENIAHVLSARTTVAGMNTACRNLIQSLDGYYTTERFPNSEAFAALVEPFKVLHLPKTVADYVSKGTILNPYTIKTLLNPYEVLPRSEAMSIFETFKNSDDAMRSMLTLADYVDPEMADVIFEVSRAAAQRLNIDIPESLNKKHESIYRKFQLKSCIEQIQKSPVVFEFDMSNEKMEAMLRYNNVSIPETYTKDSLISKIEPFSLVDLNVEKLDLPQDELDAITVSIEKNKNHKHGDVSLKVLEAFDVNILIQEDGVAQKISELDAEKFKWSDMEPVYHGCGPLAANMILRYGFTVIPSSDPSFAGSMLGEGVYFTNVSDKASQYVKRDDGKQNAVNRDIGTVGYFFEMYALLGRPKKDYTFARGGSKIRGVTLVSDEWCAHDYKRQLIIRRAYRVEKVRGADVKPLMEAEFKSFDNLLNEDEVKQLEKKNALCVILVRDQVTEEMTSKFGKNVKLDSYNSFIVYNDLYDGVYQISSLEDLPEGQFEKILAGDVEDLMNDS